MFPEELKGFKVKKNPTLEEINSILDEIEVILEMSTVNDFIIEPVMKVIEVSENIISANIPSCDIRGLATALKLNKEFNKLSKQLYLKYGSFMQMPPEYQLCFIVASTAYLIRQKNLNRNNFEAYINQPVN